MAYIGAEPIVSATRTVTEVTATAGQTVFTANGGYTVGFLDVFINGSKLTSADFTATNGTTVTLTEAAQVNDIVRLEALGTFLASSALSNVNPSYTGTLTGGTGVVNIGSGQLYKGASGNVGVGTSSPDAILTVSKASTSTTIGGSTAIAKIINSQSSALGETAGIEFFNRNGAGGSAKLAGIYGVYTGFNTTGFGGALSFATEADGGTNVTERMRLDSSGNLAFNSGYGSVATAYGCRAWVNFNGTGTPSIRASGNVSSITDLGTGLTQVNLANAMPDSNYTVAGFAASGTGSGANYECYPWVSTSSIVYVMTGWQGSYLDLAWTGVAVFR